MDSTLSLLLRMQNSAEGTCRGDVGCDCVTRLHSLVVTVDTVYCVHCILLFIITRLQVLSSLHYITSLQCSAVSHRYTGQCWHCFTVCIICRCGEKCLHSLIITLDSVKSLQWTVSTLDIPLQLIEYSVYYLQVGWKVIAVSHHYKMYETVFHFKAVEHSGRG